MADAPRFPRTQDDGRLARCSSKASLTGFPTPLEGFNETVFHGLSGSDEMWSILPTHPGNRAADCRATLLPQRCGFSAQSCPTPTLPPPSPTQPLLFQVTILVRGIRSLGTGTFDLPFSFTLYVTVKIGKCIFTGRIRQIQALASAYLVRVTLIIPTPPHLLPSSEISNTSIQASQAPKSGVTFRSSLALKVLIA